MFRTWFSRSQLQSCLWTWKCWTHSQHPKLASNFSFHLWSLNQNSNFFLLSVIYFRGWWIRSSRPLYSSEIWWQQTCLDLPNAFILHPKFTSKVTFNWSPIHRPWAIPVFHIHLRTIHYNEQSRFIIVMDVWRTRWPFKRPHIVKANFSMTCVLNNSKRRLDFCWLKKFCSGRVEFL